SFPVLRPWRHPRLSRAVRALVRSVTGLPEEELGSDRFQAALNFVWSNIRFHRFLDVNSHKVERTIEGIHEKLVVHSDLGKAASWKRLTEKFLNLPLPSIEETKVRVFQFPFVSLRHFPVWWFNNEFDLRKLKVHSVAKFELDGAPYSDILSLGDVF
uniref:Uncharacterized protein n=1 Tax=Melopsittacus undulatus TaxID=13146 RepID=A0A8V5GC56_MELUD